MPTMSIFDTVYKFLDWTFYKFTENVLVLKMKKKFDPYFKERF